MELVVGRIGQPHGLRGEVTVEVRTDDPAERFTPGTVLATDPASRGPLTVTSQRRIGGNTVLGFEGFPDRTAAENLRGTLLLVEAEALPEIEDEDEYYDHQLVGLAVRLVENGLLGEAIGAITDVLHLPANDVLVVATDRVPGGELLVPFVSAVVPTVDLTGGFVSLDPPDGMFD